METINRNNYEEFFLLYVDGELDAARQLAVENFVQQNPDLAVELEMILHTKLTPETIAFDNKETLIRTEGNCINETNYEEYFLLYIDNELSDAKREEVEMYVLKHPRLQEEFITLKDEFKAETKTYNHPVSNIKKNLQDALNTLNETQKSLVLLKDYEGYSYEEIGQITGLNESQVKVYLHRARLNLRNYLVKPENVL